MRKNDGREELRVKGGGRMKGGRKCIVKKANILL